MTKTMLRMMTKTIAEVFGRLEQSRTPLQDVRAMEVLERRPAPLEEEARKEVAKEEGEYKVPTKDADTGPWTMMWGGRSGHPGRYSR